MPELDLDRFPNADDVKALLHSASFWPAEGTPEEELALVQAQINVENAIDEFEQRTGWFPFLCTEDSREVRTYQLYHEDGLTRMIPGGLLPLNAGVLAVHSVTVNGAEAIVGQGVFLRPTNAASRRRPFTALHFPRLIFGNTYCKQLEIQVDADWGYTREMPGNVFSTVLRQAAVGCLTELEQEQDPASISQDGFTKAFDIVGVITPKNLLDEWPKKFDALVKRYSRVTV